MEKRPTTAPGAREVRAQNGPGTPEERARNEAGVWEEQFQRGPGAREEQFQRGPGVREEQFQRGPGARRAKNMPAALILAGGRGRRLGELTARCPKPLLPVAGKPLIVRILEDLIANGVTRAAVLTGYLGDLLERETRAYRPEIELAFFREGAPLGSAGCIRAAKDFAGDRFFVVCGDAFGARDYVGFCENHVEKRAAASILLASVDAPGEFGLVLTDQSGRVRRFVEKPFWSGVFTDRVNTGIYLFEKSVFDYIPPDRPTDFAKDIFPALLRAGEPVFGYDDGGFWCDVGEPSAFLSCSLRANGGKSVIGKGCAPDGAVIEDSVLFDRVSVGKGSVVRRAILMRGAQIGRDCTINEGCLVGESAVVPDGAVLPPGQTLPAGCLFEAERDREYGIRDLRPFFSDSVLQIGRRDRSFARRLGEAFAKALPPGSAVGLFHREDPDPSFHRELSELFCGLARSCRPEDRGAGFPTLAAFDACHAGNALTLFSENERGVWRISLFDRNGMPPPASFIRAVRDAFSEGAARMTPAPGSARGGGDAANGIGEGPGIQKTGNGGRERSGSALPAAREAYAAYLRSLCPAGLKGLRVHLTAASAAGAFLAGVLLSLGAELGMNRKECLRVRVYDDGLRCEIADESGKIDFWHASALLLDDALARGEHIVSLPCRAPEALFSLAGKAGVRPAGFSLSPPDETEDGLRAACAGRRWLFDGCAAAAGVLALIKESGRPLSELLARLPPFSVAEEVFDCPPEEKLRCLLISDALPAGEGVFRESSGGRAALRALGGRGLALQCEAADDLDARRLLAALREELEKSLTRE